MVLFMTNEHIFRAYDIRGIVNKDLSPEIIMKASAIFANIIQERGGTAVAASGDVRASTPALLYAAISGIISSGLDVIFTYPLPIPVFNYFVWSRKNLDGGAFITASHNPPEYNGIRFRYSDGTGFSDDNRIVKERYLNNIIKFADWTEYGQIKSLPPTDILDNYLNFIANKIHPPQNPMKIALDGMYGAANLIIHRMFELYKHKTLSIHAIPNGSFPLGMPDPLHGNTSAIKEVTITNKADLGIAYDGDGDRAAFFDSKGRLIPAEFIGLYLAEKLLRPNDTIVYNVMCSSIIKRVAEDLGLKTVESKVGDVFVAEVAKKHNAKICVEESYHFFLPIYGFYYDDSIMTSIVVANLMSNDGLTGEKLFEKYGPIYTIRENIPVNEAKKFEIIEKFAKWAEENYSEISTIDGVKIYLDNGSFLARPSNTEPLIRVMADADSEAHAREILSKFSRKLKEFMT